MISQTPRRRDRPFPIWERGKRVHGYWLDGQRMGHVGLSPRGFKIVYSWAIDADSVLTGEAVTLRAAKRRVEVAYRRAYSWMYPESRVRRGF